MDMNGRQIVVKFSGSRAADALSGGSIGIFLVDADPVLAHFSMEIRHEETPGCFIGRGPMLKAIRPESLKVKKKKCRPVYPARGIARV